MSPWGSHPLAPPGPFQVSALLAVAREIPLSPAQAKEVIRKAISCARCGVERFVLRTQRLS
jgi:hypothetical protein